MIIRACLWLTFQYSGICVLLGLRDLPMSDSVAIIGIGCRFPGDANNASNLWNMLMDGVDAVSEVFPE